MSVTETIETATDREKQAAVGFAYQVLSDPANVAVSAAYEVQDNVAGVTYTYTDLLRALRVLYIDMSERVLH